jgi:hypothetical protein
MLEFSPPISASSILKYCSCTSTVDASADEAFESQSIYSGFKI